MLVVGDGTTSKSIAQCQQQPSVDGMSGVQIGGFHHLPSAGSSRNTTQCLPGGMINTPSESNQCQLPEVQIGGIRHLVNTGSTQCQLPEAHQISPVKDNQQGNLCGLSSIAAMNKQTNDEVAKLKKN